MFVILLVSAPLLFSILRNMVVKNVTDDSQFEWTFPVRTVNFPKLGQTGKIVYEQAVSVQTANCPFEQIMLVQLDNVCSN